MLCNHHRMIAANCAILLTVISSKPPSLSVVPIALGPFSSGISHQRQRLSVQCYSTMNREQLGAILSAARMQVTAANRLGNPRQKRRILH